MSNSITQKMKYKQSVIKFSEKYGVGLSNICHTNLEITAIEIPFYIH